jgi:hypothetical protein
MQAPWFYSLVMASLSRFELILAKSLPFDLPQFVKVVGDQAYVASVERFIVDLAALLQTIPIK